MGILKKKYYFNSAQVKTHSSPSTANEELNTFDINFVFVRFFDHFRMLYPYVVCVQYTHNETCFIQKRWRQLLDSTSISGQSWRTCTHTHRALSIHELFFQSLVKCCRVWGRHTKVWRKRDHIRQFHTSNREKRIRKKL